MFERRSEGADVSEALELAKKRPREWVVAAGAFLEPPSVAATFLAQADEAAARASEHSAA